MDRDKLYNIFETINIEGDMQTVLKVSCRYFRTTKTEFILVVYVEAIANDNKGHFQI